jgi:hypothetical protein
MRRRRLAPLVAECVELARFVDAAERAGVALDDVHVPLEQAETRSRVRKPTLE